MQFCGQPSESRGQGWKRLGEAATQIQLQETFVQHRQRLIEAIPKLQVCEAQREHGWEIRGAVRQGESLQPAWE